MSGRVRQQVRIDRRTGAVHAHAEILPGAGFGQRVRELMESMPAGMLSDPGAVRIARLACDGCGATCMLSFGEVAYPPGWQERPEGDFCPACGQEQ